MGAQLLELHIILGELASDRLEQVDEVLRSDAADPQQLQSTALAAHYELALESCALANSLIARKDGIDALVGLRFSNHFRYGGETVFFYTQDSRALMHALEAWPAMRTLHRPSNLEDLFLKLTGRQIREEG